MPEEASNIDLIFMPIVCGKLRYPDMLITWTKNSNIILDTENDLGQSVLVYPSLSE
jgi:hypothetical protein